MTVQSKVARPNAAYYTIEECTLGPTDIAAAKGASSVLSSNAPRLHAQRNRPHDEPLDPHIQEGIEERACMVELPEFGEGKVFPTMQAFRKAHSEYADGHFVQYRIRTSDTAESANSKLEAERVAAGSPRDEAFIKTLIPFTHLTLTLRCKRGLRQKSRAKPKPAAAAVLTSPTTTPSKSVIGKKLKVVRASKKPRSAKKAKKVQQRQRLQIRTTFTGCEARICATAERHPVTGLWQVVTSNEVVAHNHRCSQQTIDSLAKSALLERPDILVDAAGMMMAGAHATNVCDTIFAKYGIRITPKMLANIKRDRLGGKSAIENLKLLLARFSTFSGSRSLIIYDQLGNICGVIIQSAAQRAFFRRFGRNLLLDWTHNTNNLGFYLGSLMVTSVTGHGVSVADFLCLDQSKAMMKAVLEWFIEKNPTAAQNVQSFVIDKDYTEWAVLRELFPAARVLLCQFHAIRWFATVVQQKKYNIGPRLKEKVLDILQAMVYAKTTDAFNVLKDRLEDLLAEASPAFLQYMADRWYNCRPMWSDCERGSVFTALNTTTNRIESAWNQIKKVLGKKLRIDLCLEAIFAYQTAVLSREYSAINDFVSQIVLRTEAHPFVRASLSAVCDFAADAMDDEWNSYVLHDTGSTDSYVAHRVATSTDPASPLPTYAVCRPAAGSTSYAVDPNRWTCTCHSRISSGLPCRHVFFVARRVLQLDRLPLDAVDLRWRVYEARDLLVSLTLWRTEIGSLRTGLIWSDTAFSKLLDVDYFENDTRARFDLRRIAYFRLQRGEVSDEVVMTHLEKRGVLEAAFARVTQFLITQSTPKFIELACELLDALRALMDKWRALEAEIRDSEDVGDSVSEADFGQDDDARDGEGGTEDLDEAFAGVIAADSTTRSRKVHLHVARQGGGATAPVRTITSPHDSEPLVHLSTRDRALLESECGEVSARSACDDVAGTAAPVGEAMHEDKSPPVTQSGDQFLAVPFPREELEEDSTSITTEALSSVFNRVAQHDAKQHDTSPLPVQELDDDTTSVATDAVSSVLHRVALHDAEVGEFMGDVARFNMPQLSNTFEARGSIEARLLKKRPPKPAVKDLKMHDLRDILGSDYSSDEDTGAHELHLAVSKANLPTPLGQGTTKKLKTNGKATGERKAYVLQESACAVSLPAMNQSAGHTRDIAVVLPFMSRYPHRFTGVSFERMDVSVCSETFPHAAFHVDFAIPKTVACRIEKAFVDYFKAKAVSAPSPPGQLIAPADPPIVVDIDARVRSHLSTQLVARFVGGGTVRGFSLENLSDLQAFHKLRLAAESFALDGTWLKSDGLAELPRIPYASTNLLARLPTDEGDISWGARASIAAVLSSCSLRTSFGIRTSEPAYKMTIRVEDVLGFCARSVKVNDAVLVYALKQMAADFGDVFVFDSVGPISSPLALPARYRYVMFPINYSNVHWCLIVVGLRGGVITDVAFYDPLQGSFDSAIQVSWDVRCLPALRTWFERSGSAIGSVPATRTVNLEKQHDYTSCGVYCAAIAYDFMSGSDYHQGRKQLGISDACQFRVRIMWRIFCDSWRADDHEAEKQAAETAATFSALHSIQLPVAVPKTRELLRKRMNF